MGWKNVKEHYGVTHTVQVRESGICIGSGYIHDLIVISPTGGLVKRYTDGGSEKLLAVQQAMDSDPELLTSLVARADFFETSLQVFTFNDGKVVEKKCEAFGWPNVTHDGEMMFENTFFTVRADAEQAAMKNVQAWENMLVRDIGRLKEELRKAEDELASVVLQKAALEAEIKQGEAESA